MILQEEWEEQSNAIVEGIKKGWVSPVINKTYRLEKVRQQFFINKKVSL